MMRYQPSDLERTVLCHQLGIVQDETPSWYITAGPTPAPETSGEEGRTAGPRQARLYVHKMIGGWRQDSGAFVEAVHALDVEHIDLHVNSPGGIVFDAVSMYEALRTHPARVVAHVDGLAASAASVLVMAADEIEIARGARMMVHDARGGAWGDPAELRAAAELVDSVSDDLAEIYAARAGGKPADWRAAMTRTTWYNAAEAVKAKLADRVAGAKPTGPDTRTRLIKARHRALTTQGG
jgi:ATP-dependent protease ClpP protease subunit